jgi:predicted O-methyltransferase YrrM
VRGLKAALRPAKAKLFGPVARAEKDYATHIPILIGLAQAIEIKRVLELGCGEYSTLTFLNKSVFPALLQLDSFETDQAWLDRVSTLVVDDSRFTARMVSGSMRSAVQRADLENYDLIFVDDSTSSEERVATIAAIATRRPNRAVVVIHDFEIQAYRDAAKAFECRFIFKAFNPQTGIVWNGDKPLVRELKRIEAAAKQYAAKLEPEDISGWMSALPHRALIANKSKG